MGWLYGTEIGREYKKIVRSKKTWGEIGEMQS